MLQPVVTLDNTNASQSNIPLLPSTGSWNRRLQPCFLPFPFFCHSLMYPASLSSSIPPSHSLPLPYPLIQIHVQRRQVHSHSNVTADRFPNGLPTLYNNIRFPNLLSPSAACNSSSKQSPVPKAGWVSSTHLQPRNASSAHPQPPQVLRRRVS